MAKVDQQILISKFEAVKAAIQATMPTNIGDMVMEDACPGVENKVLDILNDQNLEKELGAFYVEIFKSKFSYKGGVASLLNNKASLLTIAVKYNRSELAQLAFNKAVSLKLMTADLAVDLLREAVRKGRDERIALQLLAHVPFETLKKLESRTATSLIKYARRNDMKQVVQAFEMRLDYQSPGEISNIIQPRNLTFSNPYEMVRNALDSQSSGMALEIGSDVLYACSRYFNEVQKKSYSSLRSGVDAGNLLQERAATAQRARESLVKISNNPEKLKIPDGIMGKLTVAVRTIMPFLDPYKQLDHDFGDALTATKTTYDLSISIVKAYEDFKRNYPEINGEINDLITALNEGIAEIDSKDETTPDLAELRTVFVGIASNAQVMSLVTAQNLAAVDTMKTTETQFALSILAVQTALSVISTDMSLSLAHMKASAVPEIQVLAEDEIRSHMARAEIHLEEFRALVDQRQVAVQSLLPSPVPGLRTLEAA